MNGNVTRKSLLGLAAGSVALLLATAAYAQFGPGPTGGPGPMSGAGMGPMAGPGGGPGRQVVRALRTALATLDLTDDQKARIKAVFEAKRAGFESLRTQMQADAKALHDAANAPDPDPATVGAAFLKLKQDRAGAKDQFDALMADVKAVLTADQRTRLDASLATLKQLRRRG
jgi:Spy/CpxP family protein refolding chaperone